MELLFLNLGGGEIVMILLFVLIFFGSEKIPEIARTMGRTIRQVKDATNDIQRDIHNSANQMKDDFNKQVKAPVESFAAGSEKPTNKSPEEKASDNASRDVQKPDNSNKN